MLIIYQIGDIPLFFDLRAKSDDSVSVKTQRNWKVPFAEFSGVSGQTFVGDPYKPIVEAQKLDISGIFISDEGASSEKLMRGLNSLGGVAQVPIIGIRYEECLHVDSTSCCARCNPTLDFIVNYGIITSIKGDSNYFNSKEPYGASVADVNISMSLGSKWKELSKYEWDYRELRTLNPFIPVQTASTPYLPSTIAGLRKPNFFFKLDTTLSRYDPTYWGIKYSESYGGVGSDFEDLGTTTVIPDPSMWSAPPNSVYAFTNLSNPSGELTIEVTRSQGLFSETARAEISTLDLDQLDTDLSNGGYGGLYASDTIITGFANPFPGFILRNGEPLTVRPRWTYPGLYPGETGQGYNRIRTASSVGNPAKVAYLHDFGMY